MTTAGKAAATSEAAQQPQEGQLPRLDPKVEADLREIFTYHAPDPDQVGKYTRIRAAALEFAAVLLANTPTCADQSAALRKLREVVMTANASIALKGRV